ncbi:MAG: energy-coupling factor ABC transporter substrate-binding protein [Candidatus Competibacteraceae bacterium]
MKRTNLLLSAIVLVLSAIPLLLPIPNSLNELFTGTDDRAKSAIAVSHPGYIPWFKPLWEPPSDEIAGLLFALQAALGAGLLGYYIGFKRGQAQGRQHNDTDVSD